MNTRLRKSKFKPCRQLVGKKSQEALDHGSQKSVPTNKVTSKRISSIVTFLRSFAELKQSQNAP